MNHSDIKLVIDQLEQITGSDSDMETLGTAIYALETLGNQVAQQAAVIEKLTAWLGRERCYYLDAGSEIDEEVVDFLLSPTDSKQILAEWLDSVLGEPQFYMSLNGFGNKTKYEGYPIPLFKKPEIK